MLGFTVRGVNYINVNFCNFMFRVFFECSSRTILLMDVIRKYSSGYREENWKYSQGVTGNFHRKKGKTPHKRAERGASLRERKPKGSHGETG